jgi:hypothetical protein
MHGKIAETSDVSNVSILKNAFLGHEESDVERETWDARRYRGYSYKTKKGRDALKVMGFWYLFRRGE